MSRSSRHGRGQLLIFLLAASRWRYRSKMLVHIAISDGTGSFHFHPAERSEVQRVIIEQRINQICKKETEQEGKGPNHNMQSMCTFTHYSLSSIHQLLSEGQSPCMHPFHSHPYALTVGQSVPCHTHTPMSLSIVSTHTCCRIYSKSPLCTPTSSKTSRPSNPK